MRWDDIGKVPGLQAGIYIRRSDDDQSSYSPQAQDRIGRDFCATNGLIVVEIYCDDDYSGRTGERPAFERMQADAARRRIQVVVVPKMDRFARNTILCLQTYDQLRALGVLVVSVAEPYDFDSPMGRKLLSDMAATAEWYSRNLATEVSKGLREKAGRGGWVGLLPLGYTSAFDRDARGERVKGTGRAVQTADITTVRRIFTLYATGGHSDMSLAELLNSEGLTAICKGKRVPFQRDTIAGILRNRFYVGVVTYRGEQFPGAHEPAIDRALFEQCQAIRRRRTRSGAAPTRGRGGLLSELAYCDRCRARMHHHISGGGAYYRCSGRRRFGSVACDARMVRAAFADDQVLSVLRALSVPPEVQRAVLEEVYRRLTEPPRTAIDTAKIRVQLDRLRDLYLAGDEELTTMVYLSERARLQQLLAEEPPPPARMLDTERAIALLGDMAALLEAANREQRRALIEQILEVVWVDRERGLTAIRPRESYQLLAEAVAGHRFAMVGEATSTGLEAAPPTAVVLILPSRTPLLLPR
jgi:site-specific DNA recombinase